MNELKERYYGVSDQKDTEKSSARAIETDIAEFNKIPEKYRYLCAVGAGVVAEKAIKEDRSIYSSFNSPNPYVLTGCDLQVETANDGDMSVTVWDFLRQDIQHVKNLDIAFISENRKALRLMIYQNQDLSMQEKVELLEFINNPQLFDMSMF